ncbi:MAG: helix-turn-helix domain-containing protein [Gammaproteobacteria bacterium]
MQNETLNLEQAARFLHLSENELRQRARTGRIKAAKPGKRWVFLKNDLVEYLEALYASARQVVSGCEKETSQCHYKTAMGRGGLTSGHRVEKEYATLLGLPIKR